MYNIQTVKMTMAPETRLWANTVSTSGGRFQSNSIGIANRFIVAAKSRPYYSKIKYLLPMLGVGIGAARVPLIDVLNVGVATNVNFIDTDFTQSTGLQGGATKRFTLPFKVSQLGIGNFGGIGYWETNIDTSGNTYICGSLGNDANVYNMYFSSGLTRFSWGNSGGAADLAITPTNGSFYGQGVTSTSRALYKAGAQIASASASTTNTTASDNNVVLMGDSFSGGRSYLGRCAVVYYTDGTLVATDIADVHMLLQQYLINPTGK